jgi:thermitase
MGVVSADTHRNPTNDARFAPDEILVKFEPGTNAADIDKLNRSHGTSIKSRIPQIGIMVLKVSSGQVTGKVAAYEKNPNVIYAEPNYIRQLIVPNDEISGTTFGFDDQWALNNTGQTEGTADADIDWLEVYETLTADSSVIIAVNDSGLDLSHPDLNGKLTAGWDWVDNDNEPLDVYNPANPSYGHGTHVAGIAAAETNNSEGIAGIAFGTATKIMPVRIFDENGSTTILAIVNGLIFAADNGANVINMSYGGTQRSKAEHDAVKYAWNSGAVLVAAAGNYGEYLNAATWKNYPAAYKEVIAVSATDHRDTLAYYSSHGNWLSVAAPGGDLSETYLGGILSTYPGGYVWWSGTSMATPHVSGLAGLLFAQDPTRSNAEVRSIIEATVDDLGDAGFDSLYGYGRINAYAAIQYGVTPPPPPPPPGGITVTSIAPNTIALGTTIDVTTITGSGFAIGANVTFENGSGPAPTASNVVVVNDNTITATITAKGGGPPRNRVWDVRVTNLNGSSGVLESGLTVTP